jgi:hypothetical protein
MMVVNVGGSRAGGYLTPNKKRKSQQTTKGKVAQRAMRIVTRSPVPPTGFLCGSIYKGGQGTHYNALNTLNHLSHQHSL